MSQPTVFRVGDLEIAFTVGEGWGDGFLGEFAITNRGTSPVRDWELLLNPGFAITRLWRADMSGEGGDWLRIAAPDWQRDLAAGERITVGFEAVGSADSGLTFAAELPMPDMKTVLLDSAALAAPQPTVDIHDAPAVVEGGQLLFQVVLSEASSSPVTVYFQTVAGSATVSTDFTGQWGTLTFAPGQTLAVVAVETVDDTALEEIEDLRVEITGASGATVGDAVATGRIHSDDLAGLQAADVTVDEGGSAPAGGLGPLSTDGNRIVDANGKAVTLAGVNWFGLETVRGAPDGLHARNWQDMMKQMVEAGFNTIRLPFSNASLEAGRMPTAIDYDLNPDLAGLTSLQIMDKIIDYAGELGLRILLDNHRSTPGDGPESNGLWHTDGYSEDRWISDWEMLAARYADKPAVIGADLRNEPHGGTWGGGGADDWAAAAERAGNAILATGSKWLIVVEGVASYKGDPYWWGGNLQGVADRPIVLDKADRLVYSPHAYSPEVFEQPWFSDPNYPDNLPAIWTKNFGFIHQNNIAPVLVGEFGNNYADLRDQQWLDKFVAYLGGDFNGDGASDLKTGETGLNWTYWAWNPNSGDTGGILADDWTTLVSVKLDVLSDLIDAGSDFPAASDKAAAASTGEAGEAEVLVTLSQALTVPVTVDWATANGTAVAGKDYVAASGTLTFAPGETQKTVAVKILSDTLAEGDETFSVKLTTAAGAEIRDARAVVTIRDDDGTKPPPTPKPETQTIPGVAVDVDVNVGKFWADVVVRLTNTTDKAITDWTVTLPEFGTPEQIWNAVMTADGKTSNTYAGTDAAAKVFAPGQTVEFGMGASLDVVDRARLVEKTLIDNAVFDGLFI